MEEEKLTWNDRILYGWDAVKEIISRVWIYVILGIAVGAGIHDECHSFVFTGNGDLKKSIKT
jgi:hypothetical protein